jgi:Family of unknown function (DUF5681)
MHAQRHSIRHRQPGDYPPDCADDPLNFLIYEDLDQVMPNVSTQFKKGRSGNPKGRPKSSQGKFSRVRELLFAQEEALVMKAVELAKAGDTTALKLCLDRMCPPLRAQDLTVEIDWSTGSIVEQGAKVLKAMASGELTTQHAALMQHALAAQVRIIETQELSDRVARLELAIQQRLAEAAQ